MARNDARTVNGGERTTGRVARIILDKGFGFITATGGKEYFFHMSNCGVGVWDQIVNAPENGRGVGVTFETAQTAKGLRALAVEL